MRIGELFRRRIDREIQGVVMVGQDEEHTVRQELEEYVVTKELQKHFSDFYEAYGKALGARNTTAQMGVWISGFFGSGKSHFLKMLSFLLENRTVAGKTTLEYFEEDDKIQDGMLLADMKVAAQTPADVILFNIDSKSESGGGQNADSILNVFLKVFNDMQGFYGAIPCIADLERKLSEAGRFDEFKAAFAAETGSDWTAARQDFDFVQDDLVSVLTGMNFMSEEAAWNWCRRAAEPYAISSEDFAKRVHDYLEQRGHDRHVVFLIDEMGQYIGNDSQMMLRLQTVTEDLGRLCNGKAWIVVTSQQDIDAMTSEARKNATQEVDFSKIQGRFATRLSLSAANVDEVIKRRVLEKTGAAEETLCSLYEEKDQAIKNLLIFTGSAEKKIYREKQDFTRVYPFIPYQFNLLGSSLTAIRTHGASGKHLSEGARSMLALYKESAESQKERDTGILIPFYRFYDGLENFLDHSHRGVILQAYDNEMINPDGKEDVFAINVLKTLFMIKYVQEIDATLENITTLMVESVDDDRVKLRDRVDAALTVLNRQMLVQKNGSVYVFQTDEEQEINREIDHEDVSDAEVLAEVAKVLFSKILDRQKYLWPAFGGRYAFSFNQTVDDRPYRSSQKNRIGLHVITPWMETDMDALRAQSTQVKEVFLVLPARTADLEFLLDTRRYLKIDMFLRRGGSHARLTRYEDIQVAKSRESSERKENAERCLRYSLQDAAIVVNGGVIQSASRDIQARINEGMQRLVNSVYSKLSYIDAPMGESDVRRLFQENGQIRLTGGGEPNLHALEDMQRFIAEQSRRHTRVSMKTLEDRFTQDPYGFLEVDVHWLVARLFQRGELAFTVNGVAVTLRNQTPDKIVEFITKKDYAEKLLMEIRTRADARAKKDVQTILRDVFEEPSPSEDEDALMQSFQNHVRGTLAEIREMETLCQQQPQYPGRKVLESGKELLQSVLQLETSQEFFSGVSQKLDAFDSFGQAWPLVRRFFRGEQKRIFDRTLDVLNTYADSRLYINSEELETFASQMRRIVEMENPYSGIRKLPELREKFTEAYSVILNEQKQPILDAITQAEQRVLDVLSRKKYREEKQDSCSRQFQSLRSGAEDCENIATLRSYASKADALKLRLLNEMDRLDEELTRAADVARQAAENNGGDVLTSTPPVPAQKRRKNISMKNLAGTLSWRLESAEDVEQYLNMLREKLTSQLEDGVILNVEL